MRHHKRKIILSAFGFLALVALFFPLPLIRRELVPSLLIIHAPQQGWHSVRVDGDLATLSTKVARVSPIGYGPHTLRIELADGKVIWVSFFHSDTGMDRQLNIYVEHQTGSATATLQETITRFESFPSSTRTVFQGSVQPEHTSETKPAVLDWI